MFFFISKLGLVSPLEAVLSNVGDTLMSTGWTWGSATFRPINLYFCDCQTISFIHFLFYFSTKEMWIFDLDQTGFDCVPSVKSLFAYYFRFIGAAMTYWNLLRAFIMRLSIGIGGIKKYVHQFVFFFCSKKRWKSWSEDASIELFILQSYIYVRRTYILIQ